MVHISVISTCQEVILHIFLSFKGLVTNYGEVGLQNGRRGGHVKFYPYEKGGCGKSFSHAEGEGGTKSFGKVFTR